MGIYRTDLPENMKYLVFIFFFIFSSQAATLPDGVNDLNDMSLEEFEEYFGLDDITDPEEKAKHETALKEKEELVKEANEKYENGEQTWFDEINEFSDIPEDEFGSHHGGLLMNLTDRSLGYSMGWLDIPMEYDAASERFYESYRLDRSDPPASYSSVSLGNVSPVKSQGDCGSCVAFATMALVETCFKKTVGVFGDYSEQHFVDCGFGYDNLNNGCNGAAPHGYAKWLNEKKPKLLSEATYPYKAKKQTCPTDKPQFFQGVNLSGAYWTESGSEDILKKLVAKHGAVQTGVRAAGPFSEYKGGIFSGCTGGDPDHAVVVVGYGTENGVDYWLVKNSWGSNWGEKGFIRIKRGVKMCGIGGTLVTLSCTKADGTTSATSATTTATTTTTVKTTTSSSSSGTCTDFFRNCPELAKDVCWEPHIKTICCKSCGLGTGMTPAASNTCYDRYGNCADLCSWIPDQCKKSCGKC